jgi:hypothetical protein
MGRFREQVSRYLDAFPREQIRVMWFHDWVADPRSAYLQVLSFLGVEDDGRRTFRPVNEGATYLSRPLIRFLLYPPAPARVLARALKRVLGLRTEIQNRLIDRLANLVSIRGYKKQVSPELREEIRRYYAKDNALLKESLRLIIDSGGKLL